MPSVPTTSDSREGYLAAAIVVWSVPPFPSPRARILPVVQKVQTAAAHPGADLEPLYEAVADAPPVLAEKHATKLGESDGRLVEDAKYGLAVLHRQGDESLPSVQRDRKCVGGVFKPGLEEALKEVQHILVTHRNACDDHRVRSTSGDLRGNAAGEPVGIRGKELPARQPVARRGRGSQAVRVSEDNGRGSPERRAAAATRPRKLWRSVLGSGEGLRRPGRRGTSRRPFPSP